MGITGMSRTDWEKSALKDLGRNVILNRVTITKDNITGQTFNTYGVDEIIKVVYALRGDSPTYERDIEGLFEGGEAFLQAKIEDALKYQDKITVDGITYTIGMVKEVKIPFTSDMALFHYCTLKKVDS